MRRTFYFRDFTCPDEHVTRKFVESNTTHVPCEHTGCEFVGLKPEMIQSLFAVHGDEIDYVDHNLGKEPIRIRSKSERRRIMAERGLEEFIRHTPVPGTDKSPHTISWDTMDPVTMENARILVSRQGGKVEEAPVEPVANPFAFVASTKDMTDITKVYNATTRTR